MHIESLKVFCDLIDTRSFSRAASKNFISQSAVSQQVKALEDRFGRKFVERTRSGLVPTAAGLTFYEGCRQIVDRFSSLNEEMKDLGNIISGQVRLATIYSVGIHELSPIVRRFIKSYPQVNIHIEYSRPNRIYEEVISGSIDFGIVAYPSRRPQIEVVPLRSDRLVLVCSPEHSLSARKRIDIGLLNRERFVGFERDIPTRKALDKVLRAHKVEVEYVMAFDNIETIKQSVEANQGVSILPRAAVETEVRAGRLCVVNFKQSYRRPIGIIHRKGKAFTAAARRLIEMLRDEKEAAEAAAPSPRLVNESGESSARA